jgi:hypothetical protein
LLVNIAQIGNRLQLVVGAFKPSIQDGVFCVHQGFKTIISQNISPVHLPLCV